MSNTELVQTLENLINSVSDFKDFIEDCELSLEEVCTKRQFNSIYYLGQLVQSVILEINILINQYNCFCILGELKYLINDLDDDLSDFFSSSPEDEVEYYKKLDDKIKLFLLHCDKTLEKLEGLEFYKKDREFSKENIWQKLEEKYTLKNT